MSDLIFAIAVAIAFLAIGLIAGMFYGYRRGIIDTEERWSNAVASANYAREINRRVQT